MINHGHGHPWSLAFDIALSREYGSITPEKQAQVFLRNHRVVTARSACCFHTTHTKEFSCLKRSWKWRKTLFLHRLKPTNSPQMRCTQPFNTPIPVFWHCKPKGTLRVALLLPHQRH